jgi:undecaprenol kinase
MSWLSFRFLRSVQHAWRGLLLGFQTEKNFRLQLALGLVLLCALWIFPFLRWERAILFVVMLLVLVLELLNSSMERVLDLLQPRLNPYAGDVKDLMAGAVLLASIGASVLAVYLFWPHLLATLAHV